MKETAHVGSYGGCDTPGGCDNPVHEPSSPWQQVRKGKRKERNSPAGENGKRAKSNDLAEGRRLSETSSGGEEEGLDHESDLESLGDPCTEDPANQTGQEVEAKKADNKGKAEAKANPTQNNKPSYAEITSRRTAPHGRRGVQKKETAPVFCRDQLKILSQWHWISGTNNYLDINSGISATETEFSRNTNFGERGKKKKKKKECK
nr:hypothetical protein BaRGS_023095 [Batillaria attramentaria]